MTTRVPARQRARRPARPLLEVLALLGALVACVPQRHLIPADIRPLHHSTGPLAIDRVDGIRHALSRSGDAPVRVLVVHGMIQSEPNYSALLQRNVADRLDLVQGETSKQVLLDRGYDITVVSGPQPLNPPVRLQSSELRRTSWVDEASPTVERVVFYELLWAPIRDEIKNRFIACFESRLPARPEACPPYSTARPNTDARALVNRLIKDNILVGGFADAMIVLGPAGNVLRDDMGLAVCAVARDALRLRGAASLSDVSGRCDLASLAVTPDERAAAARVLQATQFFAITHSLGSFLLLDAQDKAARRRAKDDDDDALAREALGFALLDQATVFMNATQVSLLSLARLEAVCEPRGGSGRCPASDALRSEDWFAADQPLSRLTTYVAFNDIDDLLGFELPPYLADVGVVGRLVNVSVRNPALRIPGLFKHPGHAHTRQDRNPAVIEAIVDGFDVPRGR